MSHSNNQYFVCLAGQESPIPFRVDGTPIAELSTYFFRTLQAFDAQAGPQGLTVYVTWRLDRLPSYGDNVVALVLGDEWARVPAYTHRVRTVFKCYGDRPFVSVSARSQSPRLLILNVLKALRTWAYWLPSGVSGKLRAIQAWVKGTVPPPIHPIPLGYGNQADLPVRPILDRNVDVFFAGSVAHRTHPWWSLRAWLQSPKNVSRQAMLNELDRLKARVPSLTARLAVSSSFTLNALHWGTEGGEVLDTDAYSTAMMNAKICLVPRGTSVETYRYFEALRYGCVLVTERLPSRWFYDDAPALIVDDWSELGRLLPNLLTRPDELVRLQKDALAWWHDRCSETALGHYMADVVAPLAPRNRPRSPSPSSSIVQ